MVNLPEVKMGLVAVSRDCFPIELSKNRRNRLLKECTKKNISLQDIVTIVENEKDVIKVLIELEEKKINALVVYLGNFGPEGPETMLAQKFFGPTMFVAAAEDSGKDLFEGRGDAYCGMLSASYNIGLKGLSPYIPAYPVGTPEEIAEMIFDFEPIARILIGLKNLKIITFGPRPQDFLTCHAPLKPLYDLGIEVMENSELDLLEAFQNHKNDSRIPEVVQDMKKELGKRIRYPEVLPKLAQYEVTLQDLLEKNLGAFRFGVFANKCWPAFQTQFGFVPCYVNSRFASRGIPIACETDIYGALSEYIITLATCLAPTLLDINNTVPRDIYEKNKNRIKDYKLNDLFMGFHCGNTSSCYLKDEELKYQLIMHRFLEKDKEPDITRGNLEGTIIPGDITIFRLQGAVEGVLKGYIAEGEVLDINPQSFGGIGVFAIKEMARFYRYVLIEKRFPHHTGVAFKHTGKILFEALKILGVEDISYNQPKHLPYPEENPFS
ncbi:MAG: fucose isomerase [Candidatus Caldatribacteriota bacterium]